MKLYRKYAFSVMLSLPLFYFAGCRNALQIPATFTLGDQLGTFEVTAGTPTQNSGTGNLGDATPNIGSGTLSLKASDITFTPAGNGGGKGRTNLQSGGGSF